MQTLDEVLVDMAGSQKPCYVYILFSPDGIPFYVGKGKSKRIAAHEQEARYYQRGKRWSGINTLKLEMIASIQSNGGKILYQIDSWHDRSVDAGARELQLVEQYGRQILGTGTLTNIRDGGDLLTEEDRAIIGRRIKQFYLDYPEAKQKISLKLKDFCNEHPEFVEHLQNKKNEWIRENPEAYQAAERKRMEVCLTEENRQSISRTLKEYYRDNPEALRAMSERAVAQFASEEARERARQASIENGSHESIIKWLREADPEKLADKWRRHSDWLTGWHQTDEGKEKTAQAACKRNAKFRTDEHRAHMAEKSRQFIANNPEAHKKRRENAAKSCAKLESLRQRCYRILESRLVADERLRAICKKPNLDSRTLYKWRKRGLVPDYFPIGGNLKDWERCLLLLQE